MSKRLHSPPSSRALPGAHLLAFALCLAAVPGLSTVATGCTGPSGPACELSESSCADLCVDTATSTDHCGGCDLACVPEPNEVPACAASICEFTCVAGYGDCDSSAAGCETDVTSSLAHCGACNSPCANTNGVAACVASACVIGACDAGFADLDGATGCEAAFSTTETMLSLPGDAEAARANVFADSAGNLYLGWRDYDGAGLVLRYSAYDAVDATWSTPIAIQDHDAGDGPSFVERPDGAVMALWRERDLTNTTQSYYYAARVYADGSADPALLAAGPGAISSGRLVFDDAGQGTVAWVEDGTVRYATLAPGGSAFVAQGELLGAGDQDANLVVYPASVGAVAIFSRVDSGARTLDLARYDTEAGRYYAAEPLRAPTAGVVPSLVGLTTLPNGRDVMVVRETSSETFESGFWLQTRASGGAWSTPLAIDAPHEIAAITFRPTSAGDLRLLWQRRDQATNSKRIVTALVDGTTGALGDESAHPETYSASSINGWAVLVDADNDLLVAWLSNEDDVHHVRLSSFEAATNRWGSSTVAEDTARSESVSQLRLAVRPNGERALFYVRARPNATIAAGDALYEVTLPL